MSEPTATTARCCECEQSFEPSADGHIPAHETPYGVVGEPHPPCRGSGRAPLVRKDYVVRGVLHIEVRVPEAKNADEAAYIVENPDGEPDLDIDYGGISIDEVVSADKAEDWKRPRRAHQMRPPLLRASDRRSHRLVVAQGTRRRGQGDPRPPSSRTVRQVRLQVPEPAHADR